MRARHSATLAGLRDCDEQFELFALELNHAIVPNRIVVTNVGCKDFGGELFAVLLDHANSALASRELHVNAIGVGEPHLLAR